MMFSKFTSNSIPMEMLRYVMISGLGFIWNFLILYIPLDVLKIKIAIDIGFMIIDTWKIFFVVGAVFGLFHNFFLNKYLGGISRFESRKTS